MYYCTDSSETSVQNRLIKVKEEMKDKSISKMLFISPL